MAFIYYIVMYQDTLSDTLECFDVYIYTTG